MHSQMMDNNSYNIIMALASNLEALEAYHKYGQDGNQQLWQQAIQHTEQVVQLLQGQLSQVAQQGMINRQSQGSQTQGQSNYGSATSGSGTGSYSQGSTGMGSSGGFNTDQGMSGQQSSNQFR